MTNRPAIDLVYFANGYNIARLRGDINRETVFGSDKFAGIGGLPGYVHEFHRDITEMKLPFGIDLTNCKIKSSPVVALMADAYRLNGNNKFPLVCDEETEKHMKLFGAQILVNFYRTADEILTSFQSGQTAQA